MSTFLGLGETDKREADLDAEREGLVFEADGVPVGSVFASGKWFNFLGGCL